MPATDTILAVQDVSEGLRRQRLRRQLSQQTLAERSGIAIRTLARMEAGSNVDMETFLKIVGGLKMRPSSFFRVVEGDAALEPDDAT